MANITTIYAAQLFSTFHLVLISFGFVKLINDYKLYNLYNNSISQFRFSYISLLSFQTLINL